MPEPNILSDVFEYRNSGEHVKRISSKCIIKSIMLADGLCQKNWPRFTELQTCISQTSSFYWVPNLNLKFVALFLSFAHINGTNKRNGAFLLIEVNKTLCPTYVIVYSILSQTMEVLTNWFLA